MEIDVKKLNQQKNYTGTVMFSYDAPADLVSVPYAKFDGPVQIDCFYDVLADGRVHIVATVRFTLVGYCTRCMDEAKDTFETTIDEIFVTRDDGESYTYSHGVINLLDAVRDALIGAMPYKLLCREDCPGIEYNE